jgi:exodeoxyribonuclease V gamma subunit
LLLDRAAHAPVDDSGYREDFPDTLLGHLQSSILNLTELAPGSIRVPATDRSIEIHVCHSLTRELEVLHDQLLALLAAPAPPRAGDILVVTPDLEAAAPLIEAVFGNAPADRRLPFVVSGRGRSSVNAAARALLALLAIPTSRFRASALIELLQQPMIGRRFGIAQDELRSIQGWMQESGIRWGINGAHRREYGLPEVERFSVEDGLHRLFLGYALPERVSTPALGRVAAGNAEGAAALDLGRFAHFVACLEALRSELRKPRTADAWLATLHGVLDEFLAPSGEEIDALDEVRQSMRALHTHMVGGDLAAEVPLQVLRAGLATELDDPARGAVPSGAITFCGISSLRNLPYRVICAVGLNDGAFPRLARVSEFDLMAAAPRRGDRQRRAEDRGLFLDLLLSARQHFYLSYTGRSVRSNAVLPPSALISELLETLRPAIAAGPEDSAPPGSAYRRLVVEHPLQAFSTRSFEAGADPRLRSFDRELFDALRHSPQHVAGLTEAAAALRVDPAEDDDDEESEGAFAGEFFAGALAAPGAEARQVSLEQLLRFFRNPCQFLLRYRLGLAFAREEGAPADDEPFVPDFDARRALAERLLPQAMQGLGSKELERLAAAGIEYPPGALGLALLDREMASMRRFAATVRQATAADCLAPTAVDLAFELEGEDWHLATVFSDLRPEGLVRHRYDDVRPADYIAGWLTHLVMCAAPPAGMMLETQWISRDGSFRLVGCPDARAILESLLLLYRRGLREPLHFFPKSAWEYIWAGRDLGKARSEWHPTFEKAHGEDRHEAYQLAFRGKADPIDADFADCAERVFGRVDAYIDDVRLGVQQPRAGGPV